MTGKPLALSLILVPCLGACAVTGSPPPLGAQQAAPGERTGYEDVPQSGGPGSVGADLKEDHEPKEPTFRFEGLQRGLAPWFDWKARMAEEHGFALGVDYTGIYYGASSDLVGEDDAGSGILRLFGSWTLVGRESGNTGSLVFKVEDRHAYGDVPVSGLGFETGYVGLLGPPFNDSGSMLTNLFWLQKFNDNHTTVLAGIVDATDYLDIYGLINPWSHFSNLVFTTGSGTMPAPNQGVGATVGSYFADRFYAVAGVADSNGDPSDPGASLETAFDEAEYFSHVELGLVSSFEERYLNNTHVTFWHAAERESAGVPDGWGANFSFARLFGGQWMPFLRAGYSEDGGALLENSVSAGVGYYMPGRSDLVALGVNWGQPSEDFGPDAPDQITSELFYRLQLSPNTAVTPTVQYVNDPALHPSEDSLWFLGVRARLSL